MKTLKPLFPPDNAIRFAASPSAPRFGSVRRLRQPRCVTYTLGLLLFAPVKIFALELGEASIKNALGESLLVEIPYRLAASEQLTPACVKLAPAPSRDAPTTYTRADRITISSTTIEIFDHERVIEPLIGLTIDIDCDTALHFIRTYELLVDLPAQAPASSFAATPSVPTSVVASGTTTVAAADQVASAPVAKAVRANASRRARGHAGGNVAQGQSYRVVRGDTLSGIAARIADRPATIRETGDAIFAANPNAFTHGNPDLIEEGRSIAIPILARAMTTALAAAPAPATTATAPAPAGGSELPSVAHVRTFEPVTVPPVAAEAPRAEESAEIVAPGATADITPVAAAVAEPIVAPTPTEVGPGAESRPTARLSLWLTGLLALGIGVLLSAPFVIVWRRRQQSALTKIRDYAQKRHARWLAPVAGIEVVESRTAETPADAKTAPRRSAVERVAREQSRDPDVKPSVRAMDDEQTTLTVPQLDMLRQDYEAERTLTQQLSPELRDAVADLQATKAREASKAQSLLESDDTEAWTDSSTVRMRK